MTPIRKPPTLEEIAGAAGVSRSTVSRVINNEPNVRESVRQRVWQFVEEMGYHPNAAARSLASNQTHILGAVIPQAVNNLFVDPFFPLLLQGIADAASDHDYHLMLSMISGPAQETDFYRRALRSQMLDGVVISSAFRDDPILPLLQRDGVPFVTVGRCGDLPDTSYVDVDNVGAATQAVLHLIENGRERIGHIAGPLRTNVGVDRLEGYRKAHQKAGLDIDDELIAEGDFTEESGFKAMLELMEADPDAVFVSSDLMAVGAMRALHTSQIAIPDQVAIVGFDDAQIATVSGPPLTTVRQPVYKIGYEATTLLLSLIAEDVEKPVRRILPTELIVRATSGTATT